MHFASSRLREGPNPTNVVGCLELEIVIRLHYIAASKEASKEV